MKIYEERVPFRTYAYANLPELGDWFRNNDYIEAPPELWAMLSKVCRSTSRGHITNVFVVHIDTDAVVLALIYAWFDDGVKSRVELISNKPLSEPLAA